MANEWTIIELLGPNRDGEPRRFTIASSAAVVLGDLMTLSSARTAASSSASAALVAGCAAEGKTGTDYVTSISVLTQGIFGAVASGAVTAGQDLQGGVGDNTVSTLQSTAPNGAVRLGYAFNTVADGGAVQVRLDL